MRVCLVSYEYPPETADGGIGTQTWNKAHGLSRLGHSVEVLSCAGATRNSAPRTSQESGITVHRMRRPGEGGELAVPVYEQAAFAVGYSWSVLENLHRLNSQQPFDLINFPEYGAEGFAFQTNRAAHNWVPVIVQLHAPLAMLAERMGWPDKNSRHYRTVTFMERESIRLADGWTASSANIADFSADAYEIPREDIDVVHCGVDCSLFRPAVQRPQAQRPTVLFVGNVTESKGVMTVLEAVDQLRRQYPNILFRIAGKGDLGERLLAQSQTCGMENNVERIPFVRERASMVELFQQADVFASPADHENGVANVYVEAMACGCPVIAANTGGAPEAVVDGQTGFLVPPRDAKATITAIDRILGHGKLQSDMRIAARERALQYFSQDKYVERVLAAYRKTIERSHERLKRMKAEGLA